MHLRGGLDVIPAEVLRGLQVEAEPALSWSAVIEPVPLARPRVTRYGTYLPDADRVYREELWMLWRLAGFARRTFEPLRGDLFVALTFAGSSSRRPDLSNLVKAIEDAANPSNDGGWRGLWIDDVQIVELYARIRDWGRGVSPRIDLDIWSAAAGE